MTCDVCLHPVDAIDMVDHLAAEHPAHGQHDTPLPLSEVLNPVYVPVPTAAMVDDATRNLRRLIDEKPPTRDDLTLVD